MTRRNWLTTLGMVCLLTSTAQADDPPADAAGDEAAATASADATASETFELKYKFKPGDVLKWNVEHRASVKTTVAGSTQTADTLSKSVKVWRVIEIDAEGNATFEHLVESIDMRQELTGRQEVRYNSLTDAEPPLGFEDVAKSVGAPLVRIAMDPRGKVASRKQLAEYNGAAESQITVPLPEGAVAVGHRWTFPYDIDVSLQSGGTKKVKSLQAFELKSVSHGIAVIAVETQILTPIRDPAIEAQLIQQASKGEVRFDIDAGLIVGQQMDLDKRVHGFSGEASLLHYVTRFTEELIPKGERTASRPARIAGPQPAP